MANNVKFHPTLRFALLMNKVCALFGLATFVFILTTGIELQHDRSGSVGFERYIASSIILLVSSLLLIVATEFSEASLASVFATFGVLMASLWTWSGSTFSCITLVTMIAWVHIAFRQGIYRYETQNMTEPMLPRKLTSFSSTDRSTWGVAEGTTRHVREYMPQLMLIVCNIAVFVERWNQLAMTSTALALARAGAATINLNLGIIVFPTLLRVWSVITKTFLPEKQQPVHLKSIFFHRLLALVVLVGSFMHIQGHNAYIATRKGEIYLMSAWITGVFLTAIIFSLCGWSFIKPPRKQFEQVHFIGGIVGTGILFAHGPSSIYWCLPGLLFTGLERLLASRPKAKKLMLHGYQRYGKSILHLRLLGNLRLKGGEYIYLNVPGLSTTEWRPFSAIPETNPPGVSLYIRVRPEPSSWTNRLHGRLPQQQIGAISRQPTTVLVDGPHSASTCNYINFKRIILMATGVGCTPVVSVLRAIRNSKSIRVTHLTVAWILPLSEVNDFVWMLREIHSACSWATCNASSIVNVRVHVYITGCVPGCQVSRPEVVEGQIWSSVESLKRAVCNPVTPSVLQSASIKPRPWMQVEVWRGRPFFCSLLAGEKQTALDDQFQGKIGVFCCGPPPFVRDVRNAVGFLMEPRNLLENNENEFVDLDDNHTSVVSHQQDTGSGKDEEVTFSFHREVF